MIAGLLAICILTMQLVVRPVHFDYLPGSFMNCKRKKPPPSEKYMALFLLIHLD